MTSYTPAEAAEKSGFSIDTLRYYEKIGLLSPVARTAGGRRRYSDDDVGLLHLLRCLRDTDMPIVDMHRFVTLLRGGEEHAAERLAVLRDHEVRVERRIGELRQHQQLIRYKIDWYSNEMPSCSAAVTMAD
ncbi:MerR family transcriptional regulator [Prauserella marina]|uniref:DNA-binding transcriptional regulator, MerR family n=1 Tax=Prauserella marina TaxID=530584 RepID=A0A222VXJ1_9PSEU|nr:MerR family transcriptional regulator [Prauserella marina]ASR38645.1 MerR family transcriptional regulator [Prauserella marina]PWV81973.1 DNA-binding transcriptional MerR regulator [Prauserella marina]SDD16497.1 DNA-binding transcriptional regulator, MerR family [Prauserella marina]